MSKRHHSRNRRAGDRQVLLALAETRPEEGASPEATATWDFVQRAVLQALADGDKRVDRYSELVLQLRLYLNGGGVPERKSRVAAIQAPLWRTLRRVVGR